MHMNPCLHLLEECVSVYTCYLKLMHFHHSFDKLIPTETEAFFFFSEPSLHRQLMLNVSLQVSFLVPAVPRGA